MFKTNLTIPIVGANIFSTESVVTISVIPLLRYDGVMPPSLKQNEAIFMTMKIIWFSVCPILIVPRGSIRPLPNSFMLFVSASNPHITFHLTYIKFQFLEEIDAI